VASDYLTTAEAAALLRIAPKTLRNKIAIGVFLEGEHFYKKRALGRRWKREALVGWLEEREPPEIVDHGGIPLARGRRVA
jgi:hypothetical protein